MNNEITFSKVCNDGHCKVVEIFANLEFVANITSMNEDGEWTYYCTDTNERLGMCSNTDFSSLAEAKREIKANFDWSKK